jgi:hypothetical protein
MCSDNLGGAIDTACAVIGPWALVDADRSLASDVPGVLTSSAALRAMLDVIDLRALAAHDAEDLGRADGCSDTALWWAQRSGCRISTAKDLVALARRVFTGDLSDTGHALVSGTLSLDQARALHHGTRRIPAAEVVQVQRIALEAIAIGDGTMTAESIGSLCHHARSLLADEASEQQRWERQQTGRAFALVKLIDGWHCEGFLTDEVGDHLHAQLQARSAPVTGPAGERDERGSLQRQHDAIGELLITSPTAFSGGDQIAARGHVAVEVVITADDVQRIMGPQSSPDHSLARQACSADTISWVALQRQHRPRTAHGNLTQGEEQVLREALGRIAPALGGTPTDVLNQGRRKRVATDPQRRAASRRDKGCVLPGCTVPPDRCQVHHATQIWDHGGLTDLDDLVLLCLWHHHLIHEDRWTLTHTPHGTWTATPPSSQTGRKAA